MTSVPSHRVWSCGFKSHRYRHRKPLVIRGFSSFPETTWCTGGARLSEHLLKSAPCWGPSARPAPLAGIGLEIRRHSRDRSSRQSLWPEETPAGLIARLASSIEHRMDAAWMSTRVKHAGEVRTCGHRLGDRGRPTGRAECVAAAIETDLPNPQRSFTHRPRPQSTRFVSAESAGLGALTVVADPTEHCAHHRTSSGRSGSCPWKRTL